MFYVYILASKRNGTLYIGSSGKLKERVNKHKKEYLDGFTKKYHVHLLVYYEPQSDKISALKRERQLKKWNRKWKIELIKQANPEWRDLDLNGI